MYTHTHTYIYIYIYVGFGGLGVACWPLVPKFAGSNPAEAAGFFKGEKILSTPSFGGEIKPSVPCCRFAACKRSLNAVEVVISAKLPDNILAHSSHFRRWDFSRRGGTWRHLSPALKSGGKQWQATPKNLPRMQRTRTIPVA